MILTDSTVVRKQPDPVPAQEADKAVKSAAAAAAPAAQVSPVTPAGGRVAAPRGNGAAWSVVALRLLLGLEVVAIAAAFFGSMMGAPWTSDAVGLALLLPMVAIALSSATDLSERKRRH